MEIVRHSLTGCVPAWMPVVAIALLGLLLPVAADAEDIPLSSVNAAVLLGTGVASNLVPVTVLAD